MDKTAQGRTNNGREAGQQSLHGCGRSRPPYEFYETGISEVGRGWIVALLAFLKNRAGGEVVAVVAILVLWRIASELIKEKSGLDGMALAGCLAVGIMIFVIGFLAMLRATKEPHVADSEKHESQKAKPGSSNECSG